MGKKKQQKWTVAAIRARIEALPLIRQLVKYTKTHSFIGFQGVPIYDVVSFVIHEAQRDDLFTRANSIAFSFFLSLFPTILTIFTLIPFFIGLFSFMLPNMEEVNRTIYQEISKVMPGEAGDFLTNFILEVVNRPKVGLLSFGFLLAIYFSSNGMLAMMRSFEKSYEKTFRRRNAFKKRMVAIGLTAQLGLFILASTVLVVMGGNIISWLADFINLSQFTELLIGLSRWVIMLLLYYFTIGSLYRFGAATFKRFSYWSPGVTLAAILSLLTSVAFSFYIDGFNRYDTYSKFYGSIATIIIVMLWLQLNSLILLIGFELNAAIAVNRDLQAVIGEEE
ncbi:MAG: YihY/virulence factor BrkB family protein [Bacteroidota bacterium]